MKKILYILLLSTLVLSACKSRKNKIKEVETVKTEEVKKEPKEVAIIEAEEKAETLLVMSLSRSVCFGACPAFEAKIYGNGTITYQGLKNVERIGMFKGKIEPPIIAKFMSEASEMGYFKLKDSYDNENVTDLPTAVTYLNYNGKKKEVTCRFGCDETIIKINKKFDKLLENVTLKQYK